MSEFRLQLGRNDTRELVEHPPLQSLSRQQFLCPLRSDRCATHTEHGEARRLADGIVIHPQHCHGAYQGKISLPTADFLSPSATELARGESGCRQASRRARSLWCR